MNDILYATAEFGETTRQFLESEVGRYLKGRAEAEALEYTEQLKTVDPDDAKKIRDLQNGIYRAESVVQWLIEAIEEGDEAINTFIEETD